jgi:hypothetical protein
MQHTSHSTKQRIRLFALLFSALFLMGLGTSWAQSDLGSLTGTVKDPRGAVIPGAEIRVTETNTQLKWTAKSSSDGVYEFSALKPGVYDLAISVPGFKSTVRKGITVSVASTASLDLTLQVGATSETVTVEADASPIETDTSDVGFGLKSEEILDLPLNIAGQVRNPIQFVELSPAFSGPPPMNNPQNGVSFKLSGGQEMGTDTLLDGGTISFVSPNINITYGIGVEAVGEFKVETNTFDASYGRTSGGVINLVTKSGTNSFHGALYDFFKNRVLDATPWLNNYYDLTDSKPSDTQNDFGGIISGPVIIPKLFNGRDKTFFMFNYEGFRFNTASLGLDTYMTPAEENGDFSALLSTYTIDGTTFLPSQLYDYTTCVSNPSAPQGIACQPFQNNQIPQSREDPVIAAFIKQWYPQAANPNLPYMNTQVTTTNIVDADLYSMRIDQSLPHNQHLYGSYDVDHRPNLTLESNSALEDQAYNQYTHYFRLGHDWQITPLLLNHFTAGFTRRFRLEAGAYGGLNKNIAASIGLKGISSPVPPGLYPILNYIGTPGPNIGDGYQAFADNTYEFNDFVAWQHGRHTVTLGADARIQEFNNRVWLQAGGAWVFAPQNTSEPGIITSGSGFATMFLGAATSENIDLPASVGMRSKYYASYLKDDWKVNDKVTVNLGFRYEIPVSIREAHDQVSYLDMNLPNPGAGGLPGAMVFLGNGPGRNGLISPVTTFHDSFGPRIGVAYKINPITVLRAGYGVYYTNVKEQGYAENDSAGFQGAYNSPTPINPTVPVVLMKDVNGYPGTIPPFIDPTVENNQGPTVIQTPVAKPGTTQNWTLDIQRELPSQFSVDIAYVGGTAKHLQAYLHDPNQGLPQDFAYGPCLEVDITQQVGNPDCAGQPLVPLPFPSFSGSVGQALRPFPQYQNFTLDSSFSGNPFGEYSYNALQAQLLKRTSHGFTLQASYTWSKDMTDADAEYPYMSEWTGNGVGQPQNTYDLSHVRQLSQYDVTNRVIMSYLYDLPFGRGKALLATSNPVANAFVGGWKVAGVNNYQDGTPLSVGTDNCNFGIPTQGPCLPNVVPGVNEKGQTSHFVFGESRILNSAAYTMVQQFSFGDAPQVTHVRELFNRSEDLTLMKALPTGTEHFAAKFRMDFFDVLNRHRDSCFDTSVGDVNFGIASCTAYGPRNIQANLRLEF